VRKEKERIQTNDKGVYTYGIMVGIGHRCSVVGARRDRSVMNGLDILGIGFGTFMVCFYVIYVMRDWGVLKEKENSIL